MIFAILPLSLILDCAIWFLLHSLSIFHTVFEFTYILAPICKCIHTLPLIFTFIKFTLIMVTIVLELLTLPLSETIDPLTYVVASILEDHSTIAISLIIFPESIISAAWTIDYDSSAISLEFSWWLICDLCRCNTWKGFSNIEPWFNIIYYILDCAYLIIINWLIIPFNWSNLLDFIYNQLIGFTR